MRNRVAFVFVLLLGALFIPASPLVRSQAAPLAPEKPDVKVSLAVAERGLQSADSPLHVLIQNVSDTPQAHFDEWNSWGYGNLTVEWTDEKGNKGTVAKVPGSWEKNYPSVTVLQPGESLVRDISFDSKVWVGWPPLGDRPHLTLKVTYRSTGEPKVSSEMRGWIGSVVSKEQAVTVWKLR